MRNSVLAVAPLSFERPEWLWLLLVIPVAVGAPLVLRSMAALPAGRRWLSLAMRAALLIAMVLAMAGAEYVRESRNLAVVFLVDQSRSIPEALRLKQEAFLREINSSGNRPRDDKAAVISFDGKSNIEQLPMRGVFIERFTPPTEPDRTDIAQAIRMAMATFPEGMAKRIVLLSDGNQNAGNASAEASVAAANGISIDVVPMQFDYENEVMFDRLVVPGQANSQERVAIRMLLRSKRAATGTVVLYHNDRRISTTHEELKAGINSLVCEVQLNSPGAHRFEARFEPDRPEMDAIAQNNVARAFTLVQGEGSVLLVSAEPACDSPMVEALQAERVNAQMVRLENAPDDILKFLDYDAVVLANIPADRFTEEQRKMLAAYVRDMGGGLVMTGGNEGFGAGGWLGSPVEEVMPLKFDLKQRKQMLRGALVTIMHTCEMPQGNYWAEQVAIAAVNTISTMDYFGLIAWGYSSGLNWEIQFQIAQAKERIINQITKISGRIGDMPDFGPSMEMAYQALVKAVDAAQKHIIIISDGDAAPAPDSLLKKLKAAKITCSTVGIGFGVHVIEAEMSRIAEATGGRYYKVNNPKKLPQIFIKEAKIVRRPLIREVSEGFKPRLKYAMPEITSGISDAEIPPLMGHVLTTPRSAAQEFSRVLMVSDKEDPLLAVRQCELGKSVAFTGGWWTHWGRPWLGWEKFGKLWAQTLRWAMRQAQEADFEVSTRLSDHDGHIVVEAVDKDASFLNGLNITGSVLTPELKAQTVRLDQTGPGRYAELRCTCRQEGHHPHRAVRVVLS
jgi:Ca-activated chloride channel family protein